jgi:hypothetical protein
MDIEVQLVVKLFYILQIKIILAHTTMQRENFPIKVWFFLSIQLNNSFGVIMDNNDWKLCLQICRRTLGIGDWDPFLSESWCAFTTYSSLVHGVTYFNCGFPNEDECLDICTVDGGVWRQSFSYNDLAHLIVPKTFYWERTINGFESGYKQQDIKKLSANLKTCGITHRLTDIVLEIKLY